jgi:uncharacterized protein YceK
MKRIIPFVFIISIILSGCGSSKKQLQKGNYDAAIAKAVKQLRKDPNDVKQIEILENLTTGTTFTWFINRLTTGNRL